jgi:hypothetical protein
MKHALLAAALIVSLGTAVAPVAAQQNQQIIQVSNHQRCTTICVTSNSQGAGVPKAVVQEPRSPNQWWIVWLILFLF